MVIEGCLKNGNLFVTLKGEKNYAINELQKRSTWKKIQFWRRIPTQLQDDIQDKECYEQEWL